MDMWAVLYPGRYHRFSSADARAFIETHFPEEFATAYGKCWHPAMQADFFRLCYLYRNGGAYIDADDVPTGRLPEFDLAGDQFLALRPLIHSTESGEKVALATSAYLERPESYPNVEVYFNNSPIMCTPRNQVLYLALIRAKSLLLSGRAEAIGIHDSTGPTTLSLSVVLHLLNCGTSGRRPVDILSIDWDFYARVGTEAELAYKRDGRDWRKAVTEAGA
jgi:mannosyltransferase OCH1-like enzyme